jgi:type II secretory pathway pseudopilin PulG
MPVHTSFTRPTVPMGNSARRTRRPRSRLGLTLVEILVAMTVTSVLIAATVPFFVAQARAVSSTAARTDAHHNARYAVNTIDRDLRVTGVGVVDAQAMVVWAGASFITVNGDLVSHSRDASSVYSDPDAATEMVTSLGKANQIKLPTSSPPILYPDTTYWAVRPGGPTSTAETISYWLGRDSSVTNATTYILWRQVNDTKPRVVAKNLYHSAPVHTRLTGTSRPDTGKSAMTDSIRAVSVRLVGRYWDKRRAREILDTAEAFIRMPNAGLHRLATCGEAPLFGSEVKWESKPFPTGEPAIQLTWGPATDESGGEADVERYAVYRRRVSDLLFTEPIAILPAGTLTYTYLDTDVAQADELVYGVSAQDCTPSTSQVSSTTTVVVP